MKQFFSLVFLLVFHHAFTQQTITWGSLNDADKNWKTRSLLGSGGTSFYVVKSSLRKKSEIALIEKYSPQSLNTEAIKELPLPSSESVTSEYESVFMVKDKIYLLYSSFDRLTDTHTAYALTLNQNMEQQGAPVKLDEYKISDNKSLPGFSFHGSPDDSLILLARKYPYEKYENEKYFFQLLNSRMEIIWKKEIELPYQNNLFSVTRIMPDKLGNIHLLCVIAPDKKKEDVIDRTIAYNKNLLISFYPAENKIKEFEITLEGKYIGSVTADVNPKGNISVGGFYSNKNQYSIAGTFYLTLNTLNREVETKNLRPLEKEFLMEISGRHSGKEQELNDFYFDHFILNEDGSAYFVAEEYYMLTSSYFDSYTQLYQDNYSFHYNDIIIVKVNSKGEIEWSEKIPKRQTSTAGRSDFYSYSLAKTPKGLYVFFNDNPSNFSDKQKDRDQVYSLNRPNSGEAAMVAIDENGKMNRVRLFDEKEDRQLIVPGLFYQPDDQSVIIYRHHRNGYQYGKLQLAP